MSMLMIAKVRAARENHNSARATYELHKDAMQRAQKETEVTDARLTEGMNKLLEELVPSYQDGCVVLDDLAIVQMQYTDRDGNLERIVSILPVHVVDDEQEQI